VDDHGRAVQRALVARAHAEPLGDAGGARFWGAISEMSSSAPSSLQAKPTEARAASVA
jgi:hypothetical protein